MNKISIIVPCYNVSQQVGTLIDTLRACPRQDFEVILSDDESTDNTLDVLESKTLGDSRFRILKNAHAGVGATRNAALDAATGDYVVFADADDIFYPDALEPMQQMMASGAGVGQCFWINCTDHLVSFPDISDVDHWLRKTLPHGGLSLFGKILRRDVIEKYKIRFDTQLTACEDHLFIATYLSHMTNHVAVCPVVSYRYITNPMSLTNIRLTTNTFNPNLDHSVVAMPHILAVLRQGGFSRAVLRQVRYDAYHKYRRVRHKARRLGCTDPLFYSRLRQNIRKVVPAYEMPIWAIVRRLSIWRDSLRRKLTRKV